MDGEVDASHASGASGAAGAAGAPPAVEQLVNPKHLQNNMRVLMFLRSLVFIVGGLGTGVLGVTGAVGFLVFVAVHLAIAGAVAVRTGFRVEDYFPQTLREFALSGLTDQLLPFIVYWALAYTLVHVY